MELVYTRILGVRAERYESSSLFSGTQFGIRKFLWYSYPIMKKCSKCFEEKPLDDFHVKRRNKDGRQLHCKDCHKIYSKKHYDSNTEYYVEKAKKRNKVIFAENRALVIEYLRSNPCVDCGNSDIEVLQFDHRDREDKKAEVGSLLTYSANIVLKEIEKCDVRCANCHTKRTRRQLGWWIDE